MIKDIISPRWTHFQSSLAHILNMFIGIVSAKGKLVSMHNPLTDLTEIELYPELHQAYGELFLKVPPIAKKTGQAEIIYDPLGLPCAVVRVDRHTFLILIGGFDQERVPEPQVFYKKLEAYGVPEAVACRLFKNMGFISLAELKAKTTGLASVYLQMHQSSNETRKIGQQMVLLTAVDQISMLTVGLLNPAKFDLSKILELVINSLIILCDAEGAFIFGCCRSDNHFFCRGKHEDFARSLQQQWETVDLDDPDCLSHWNGIKQDPAYGLEVHLTSFTKENTHVCLGVVNPLLDEIQPALKAFSRQVNIVTELSLLYALLQEQIGFLLNHIRHGVIAVNREGEAMLINKAAYNIFECAGIRLAIGQPLVEQGLTSSVLAAVQETCDSGNSHFLKEETLALEDNSQIVHISWDVAPLQWENGEIAGAILMIEDITVRKLWEEEILKASKLESIGIMAGGIAHDFNNFLATMLANVSLAKLYGDNMQKIQAKLQSTEVAIQRAKELTQQLFAFAKGSDPLKKTVDLKVLIQEGTNFALSGSSVFPEYLFSDDLLPVEIDEGQINQVINNIVINAVQAMPEGGKIRIRAENVIMKDRNDGHLVPLPEGEYVMFSIEDGGTGIPKKHLSKIFDPFFTTKAKGSGLGLATSYKIIQKHRGHIALQSEPGIGATFSVYLPASNGVAQVRPDAEKYIKGTGKILIMDDEAPIREAVGEMLTYLGYEVEFAADGLAAINLYKEAQAAGRPFDAVVFDLTIPGGMGGRAAIAELKAINPDIKAVVASGYSNDQVMSNYRDFGFTEILVKPYKMEELSRVMHNCLAN